MGDEVSISFVKTIEFDDGKKVKLESPALFHRWGGMKFVEKAENYVKELKKEIKEMEMEGGKISFPLSRLEPGIVMVDFIRYLTKDQERVWLDLHLGKDKYDGDNTSNGHHRINLDEI